MSRLIPAWSPTGVYTKSTVVAGAWTGGSIVESGGLLYIANSDSAKEAATGVVGDTVDLASTPNVNSHDWIIVQTIEDGQIVSAVGLVKSSDGFPNYNGFNNSPALQDQINSFGAARGVIQLPEGAYRFDDSIDFKRVSIHGYGQYIANNTGGTTVYFSGDAGMYTTSSDNTAPQHKNIFIRGSSEKTIPEDGADGQVLLNLKNNNYIRLENLTLYGGNIGLILDGTGGTECHYGVMVGVNFSKNGRSIVLRGGQLTQTHNFFGGRIWDSVIGVDNTDGVADMQFRGTTFETDIPVRHAAGFPNATTYLRGCRLESDFLSEINDGVYNVISSYESGSEKPLVDTYSKRDVMYGAGRINFSGSSYTLAETPENLLLNPNFDEYGGKLYNWVPFGVTESDVHATTEGGAIRLYRGVASNGMVGVIQNSLTLKKGVYRWGFRVIRAGSGGGGIVGRLEQNGTALVQGVDFEGVVDLPSEGQTFKEAECTILRDLDNVRLVIGIVGSDNNDYLWVTTPFLLNNPHATNYTNPRGMPKSYYPYDAGGAVRGAELTKSIDSAYNPVEFPPGYELTVINVGATTKGRVLFMKRGTAVDNTTPAWVEIIQ